LIVFSTAELNSFMIQNAIYAIENGDFAHICITILW